MTDDQAGQGEENRDWPVLSALWLLVFSVASQFLVIAPVVRSRQK